MIQGARAGKGRPGNVPGLPFNRCAAFARRFNGQQRLVVPLRLMFPAQPVLFDDIVLDERRLERGIDETAHHADCARRIKHMDHRLFVARRDLH